MNKEHTMTEVVETTRRAGMYLTFSLAEETYGVEILKVREIIGMMDITSVPRAPVHVRGVINLRGKVIPVIDLRMRFSLPTVEATDETCIIVVMVGNVEMGVIVDKVCEVLDILNDEIEDAPSFGATVDTSFILGMGKSEGKVTILLDITRVLGEEEAAIL
jgi:purine-binding chemotaxis protein CheW